MHPCHIHLDFSPVRPMLDLTAYRNCAIINLWLFYSAEFVVICYNNVKTLIFKYYKYNYNASQEYTKMIMNSFAFIVEIAIYNKN
jgi:hypothetical protein